MHTYKTLLNDLCNFIFVLLVIPYLWLLILWYREKMRRRRKCNEKKRKCINFKQGIVENTSWEKRKNKNGKTNVKWKGAKKIFTKWTLMNANKAI